MIAAKALVGKGSLYLPKAANHVVKNPLYIDAAMLCMQQTIFICWATLEQDAVP